MMPAKRFSTPRCEPGRTARHAVRNVWKGEGPFGPPDVRGVSTQVGSAVASIGLIGQRSPGATQPLQNTM